MTEAEAKSEFFAEVSAWGDTIAARRAGRGEGGTTPGPTDPVSDWRTATKLLRFGRLAYGYSWLFATVAALLIILAVIGAILMAQKVVTGGKVM